MVVLNKKSANNMKKLIFVLVLLPFFSKAQFLQSFYQFYTNPMSQFFLDTSMYHPGKWQAKDYNVDGDGNLILSTNYTWQTIENKFVYKGTTLVDASIFDYYETKYEFKESLPHQLRNYRRQKNQPLLELTSTDSFAYENENIRYKYNFKGTQTPYYINKYEYDSLYGFSRYTIFLFPPSTTFTGPFEVTEFYKPNLPSKIYSYTESETKKSLSSISTYYYDSLDRVVLAFDSSYLFDDLILQRIRRISYIGNSLQPDSIEEDNSMFNFYEIQIVNYDSMNKVAQILRYKEDGITPLRLVRRIDFINPANGTKDELEYLSTVFIYPNPASDLVYLKSNEDIVQVKIYNLKGSLLEDISHEKIEQIDVSRLDEGVYFMMLQSRFGQIDYKKFIKTN